MKRVQTIQRRAPEHNSLGGSFAVLAVSFGSLLFGIVSLWQSEVTRIVPIPFLDEVFHVRQAQTYCAGNLRTWDPKITTPPGLYLASWAFHKAHLPCDLAYLRFLSGISLVAGVAPAVFLYRYTRRNTAPTGSWSRLDLAFCITELHTAVNAALFPPLFFFAGLYYTDVVSTACVLAMMVVSRHRDSTSQRMPFRQTRACVSLCASALFIVGTYGSIMPLNRFFGALAILLGSWYLVKPRTIERDAQAARAEYSTSPKGVLLVIIGLSALIFRQTNIFWIAIFPAGLALSDLARKAILSDNVVSRSLGQYCDFTKYGDKPIQTAITEDYFMTAVLLASYPFSQIALTFKHWSAVEPRRFAARLAPYVFLVLAFIGFVVWNGGVVLGDKANHVTTIHLPQMLYIWPFMLFFSWPLAYPQIIGAVLPSDYLPSFLKPYATNIPFASRYGYRLGTFGLLIILTLAIIHFNTIIHPFTLADNRHYVFYVFRILRLNPALYYAAAPVYIASAWAVLQTICPPTRPDNLIDKAEDVLSGEDRKSTGINDESAPTQNHRGASGKSTALMGDKMVKSSRPEDRTLNHDAFDSNSEALAIPSTRNTAGETPNPGSIRVSWVIVWLATSALCLVTAPLVEPRYYILPWLFWRLEIPSAPYQLTSEQANPQCDSSVGKAGAQVSTDSQQNQLVQVIAHYVLNQLHKVADLLREAGKLLHDASDHRLWLETGWFLLINAVTCYVFLYRPFDSVNEWEKGEVRRFMW